MRERALVHVCAHAHRGGDGLVRRVEEEGPLLLDELPDLLLERQGRRHRVLHLEVDALPERLDAQRQLLLHLLGRDSAPAALGVHQRNVPRALAEVAPRVGHGQEAPLAPHVGDVLLAQEVELHLLALHLVHDEPRRHVPQQLRGAGRAPDRAERLVDLRPVRRRAPFEPEPRPAVRVDQLQHLGGHEELHGLADANPAHPERALGVVSERHVFAERQHGLRVEPLLDVHALPKKILF